MKLGSATREYISYKQRIGMVFETEAVILRAFTKRAGPQSEVLATVPASTTGKIPVNIVR